MARSGAATSRDLSLFGYPIRLTGPFGAAAWRALAGPHAKRNAQAKPLLQVRFERNVPPAGPGMLDGVGFRIDFENREIICAQPRKAGAQAREAWARAALTSLTLFVQQHGPCAAAGNKAGGQVPLYLHASAVATPRGALVFCGHSTYGKSTLSTKLLRGLPLIEFDVVTVLVSLAGKRALPPRVLFVERYLRRGFGAAAGSRITPWALPLRGLFWLRKAPYCGLSALPASQAALGMLEPILGLDAARAGQHRLSLLRELLEAVPCRELSFPKDAPAVRRFLRVEGLL